MAIKLSEMPAKRGRGHTHPWDVWTDGSAWKVTRGTDYPGTTEALRVRLYAKARELGKDLEIVVDRDADEISFRFTDKAGTGEAK